MAVANSTLGNTSQALIQAVATSAFQTTTSSTQMSYELLAQGEAAAECVSMNDLLWDYRQDLTTRPVVMGLFALFYCFIIFLGVVGNICVVLAISRTRSLQTVPNMFIFSLSCSDVVVCCTSATITPITAFQKEWIFGRFLCSVAPFIAGVSLCFSTFTLAAISLDRFMLIRFPMKKPFSHVQAFFVICKSRNRTSRCMLHPWVTLTSSLAIYISVWLYVGHTMLICVLAMAMSVPVMFMQTLKPLDKYCGQFCYEDWGANANQRRAYGTLMLTLQFIIPLVVIVFCYTAISLRLGQSVILKSKKKQRAGNYEWQLQMSDQQRAATKRRQRTNRMFIAMVVAFSLSWIWTLMFNLLRDYEILPQFVKDQEFFFGILTHCIAMTSTVWNPFVYAFLNLQLRAAFWQLMPECLKQCLKESHLCGKKTIKKNGEYAQDMHLNGQPLGKQDTKRRRSSPINPSRRNSQKHLNANGRLLLSTGDLRAGHRNFEDETTATITGLVERGEPISTATSALVESNSKLNNGRPKAKYGSFDMLEPTPVYRPATLSFGIGVIREQEAGLMKAQDLHTSLSQPPVPGFGAGETGVAWQPAQTLFYNHFEADSKVMAQQPLPSQWSAYCDPLLLLSSTTSSQKTLVKKLVSSWSAACDEREQRLSKKLSQPLLQTCSQSSAKHSGREILRPLTFNSNRQPVARSFSSTFHRTSWRNSTHTTLQQQYGEDVQQPKRLKHRKSHWQSTSMYHNRLNKKKEVNGDSTFSIASNCEARKSTSLAGLSQCSFSDNNTASKFTPPSCRVCATFECCCRHGLRVMEQGWSVPNSPRILKNMNVNRSSDLVDYEWSEEKRSCTRGKLQDNLVRQLSYSTNS